MTAINLTRIVRSALSVALMGYGLRAGARFAFLHDSYQAAVVAFAPTLRAPISGTVKWKGSPYGTVFKVDEPLLEITARTVREDHLHETEVQLAKARAQLEALTGDRGQLVELAKALQSSSRAYNSHRVTQLDANLEQARALLQAAQARHEETKTRLQRAESLVGDGLQSQDVLEQVRRDQAVAQEELAASRAAKSDVEEVSAAAHKGVQVGAFGADKSYSAQRLDEVKLKLADWQMQLSVAEAEVASLERQLSVAEREAAVRNHAVVTAPRDARPWQAFVASGDFVVEGAPLVRLAGCQTPFVAASVPEETYNRASIGDRVTFRVNATKEKIGALIAQTFGVLPVPLTFSLEWGLVPPADVAFGVSPTRGSQGLVLLQLDHWPAGLECQVGATGEVLFSGTALVRWLW